MIRHRRFRWLVVGMSFGMLLGAVLASALINACFFGQAWLYVTLLMLSALSGAACLSFLQCR